MHSFSERLEFKPQVSIQPANPGRFFLLGQPACLIVQFKCDLENRLLHEYHLPNGIRRLILSS